MPRKIVKAINLYNPNEILSQLFPAAKIGTKSLTKPGLQSTVIYVWLVEFEIELLDVALFTELNCTSYTNSLDPQYITSLRPYHTLEGTELSQRSNRTLKLIKVVKADYDTWRAANSSSVPSYTFSGGSYTPPQNR